MPEPAATGQGLLATWLVFIALFAAILIALILVTAAARLFVAS